MAIQNDKGAPLPKGASLQRVLESFGCEQLPLGIKIWHPLPQSTHQPITKTWWKVLTHRVVHKIWKCMPAVILSTSDKDKSLPSKSVWGSKQHMGRPLTFEWGCFWYQQCHTENKRRHCMYDTMAGASMASDLCDLKLTLLGNCACPSSTCLFVGLGWALTPGVM